jgi:hypothetical protein
MKSGMRGLFVVWYRVVSAWIEGVASPQSSGAEVKTLGQAVLADGFFRVVGTRGIKTAVLPEKRADTKAVQADKTCG